MANFLEISHKTPKEMDFSIKNSIFISKKSGKLIKMQQFDQIFHFLFFVPNFLQKNKKFLKSQKQKFFVFVGSHNYYMMSKNFSNFLLQDPSSHFIPSSKIPLVVNFLTVFFFWIKTHLLMHFVFHYIHTIFIRIQHKETQNFLF